VPLLLSNQITSLINNAGQTMTLVNNIGQALTILTQGIVLAKKDVSLYGHYLGWTVKGTDPPYRLQAVELEVTPTREWNQPA
jgi:hypothetical protein